MRDAEQKQLKDNLWHSADVLRAGAHLAANKYGQPILGLIFLRYADILFKQHKDEIEAEYNKFKGGRMEKSIKEIAIEKCGFFLPECAYYVTDERNCEFVLWNGSKQLIKRVKLDEYLNRVYSIQNTILHPFLIGQWF